MRKCELAMMRAGDDATKKETRRLGDKETERKGIKIWLKYIHIKI